MSNEKNEINYICLINYYSKHYEEELKAHKKYCRESIDFLRERANVLERLINSLKAPDGCQTQNEIIAILSKRIELEKEYKECILYIEGYQKALQYAKQEEEFYSQTLLELKNMSFTSPESSKLTLSINDERK